MAQLNEHGRLIAAAAKAALAPLGCKRRGRSRLWYSDHRYWIIVIEFQPSGWSKGSYLNVGASWLWYTSIRFGFNAGYRVADFIPYENEGQFEPLISEMARRAADEVVAIRQKFRSLTDVYRHLLPLANGDGWPVYHAAIASGLVGDTETSKHLFQRMSAWPTFGYDWQLRLRSDSAALAATLDDRAGFRRAVGRIIEQRRQLIGLPPDPHCLDDAPDSTTAP